MAEPRRFNSVAVFCGSSIGADPAYEAAAVALGAELAKRGISLVYGGGNVGLMGTVSTAVAKHSSEDKVIGVIPSALCTVEVTARVTALFTIKSQYASAGRVARRERLRMWTLAPDCCYCASHLTDIRGEQGHHPHCGRHA